MARKNRISANGKRKTAVTAILLAAACLISAGGYWAYDTFIKDRAALLEIEAADIPLPSIIYQTAQGSAFIEPSAQDPSLYELPVLDDALPGYRVLATLQNDRQAMDFSITVDRRGDRFEIVADGFSADSRISFSSGARFFEKDIPFDWSGKIELVQRLSNLEDNRFCIEKSGIQRVRLCHTVGGLS